MPKIVDHDARRRDVAAAVWAVVEHHGAAALSVRSVAAQAGLSMGAMRHYFENQSALIRFATEAMIDDIRARVVAKSAAIDPSAPTLADLLSMLEEALPLDKRRRAEFAVWAELVMLARTSPDLADLALTAHRDLRGLCRNIALAALGPKPSRADLDRHTDALHALVDGLSWHLVLQPGELTATRATQALRGYLAALS